MQSIVVAMSQKRSVDLFKKANESREKLDYFMCSVAGALFAYAVQNYTPRKIAWDSSILEPLALACLVFGFFAGIRRIEHTILVTHLNAESLHSSESAGSATEVLMKSQGASGPFFNTDTGDVYDAESLLKARAQAQAFRDEVNKRLKQEVKRTKRWYELRNGFILGGFILLLTAKIAKAYP